MSEFTHFDEKGNAYMVDVSDKEITRRSATAQGSIAVSREVMDAVKGKSIKKGDVFTVSQTAGIMGTKRTSDLIPMCHPLSLTNAKISFEIDEEASVITAFCTAVTDGKTGVEMEALTAASVAALTVYDMCKAVQKDIMITDLCLLEKTGGVHGDYLRSR